MGGCFRLPLTLSSWSRVEDRDYGSHHPSGIFSEASRVGNSAAAPRKALTSSRRPSDICAVSNSNLHATARHVAVKTDTFSRYCRQPMGAHSIKQMHVARPTRRRARGSRFCVVAPVTVSGWRCDRVEAPSDTFDGCVFGASGTCCLIVIGRFARQQWRPPQRGDVRSVRASWCRSVSAKRSQA